MPSRKPLTRRSSSSFTPRDPALSMPQSPTQCLIDSKPRPAASSTDQTPTGLSLISSSTKATRDSSIQEPIKATRASKPGTHEQPRCDRRVTSTAGATRATSIILQAARPRSSSSEATRDSEEPAAGSLRTKEGRHECEQCLFSVSSPLYNTCPRPCVSVLQAEGSHRLVVNVGVSSGESIFSALLALGTPEGVVSSWRSRCSSVMLRKSKLLRIRTVPTTLCGSAFLPGAVPGQSPEVSDTHGDWQRSRYSAVQLSSLSWRRNRPRINIYCRQPARHTSPFVKVNARRYDAPSEARINSRFTQVLSLSLSLSLSLPKYSNCGCRF